MFGKLAPVVAFLAFTMQPVFGMAVAPRSSQDVFVPPVTYPTEGAVWTVGQTQNVTWDISNAPVNITNSKGLILLRKSGITTPVILQNGFDILLGSIEVTVPWVVEGTDYSLILLGDSGNDSPNFTITGSGVSF
ncbi:hypothetical protein GSI_09720 [Ganoderma sinense ZZ0214-1]|uniref:Transporter n=1 Tax=Ganoderma sinense ZZ0214-1 TaxID=1077348 RepID=A0A2G8S324_9APHY|nr:hypothetical protein GSI_09720 [Ganoderma sinense ZZ0214-1]